MLFSRNIRKAGFASQFKRLERTLDQFDAESYALPRTSQALLVQQPWTQRPFDASKAMDVPVYNFVSGRFADEVITLDQDVFNQPLRRDIIHKAFEYFEH